LAVEKEHRDLGLNFSQDLCVFIFLSKNNSTDVHDRKKTCIVLDMLEAWWQRQLMVCLESDHGTDLAHDRDEQGKRNRFWNLQSPSI